MYEFNYLIQLHIIKTLLTSWLRIIRENQYDTDKRDCIVIKISLGFFGQLNRKFFQ